MKTEICVKFKYENYILTLSLIILFYSPTCMDIFELQILVWSSLSNVSNLGFFPPYIKNKSKDFILIIKKINDINDIFFLLSIRSGVGHVERPSFKGFEIPLPIHFYNCSKGLVA